MSVAHVYSRVTNKARALCLSNADQRKCSDANVGGGEEEGWDVVEPG